MSSGHQVVSKHVLYSRSRHAILEKLDMRQQATQRTLAVRHLPAESAGGLQPRDMTMDTLPISLQSLYRIAG
jgi:hypothetical protein